jgi:glutaredoxin-related protein
MYTLSNFMNENYQGVIIGQKQTDFIAGVNSPLEKTVLTTDWDKYKPDHEIQFLNSGYMNAFDTQACVSFSATDCIETLFMYYLHNVMIDSDNVKWLSDNGYFGSDGIINFSDRFVAINGHTGPQGTLQYEVGDGIRTFGLIPDKMFPNTASSREEYLSGITPDMVALGKEFLKRFTINYEWVDLTAIGYGPIQGIVEFANYEKPDDILAPTGPTNHAIMVESVTPDYLVINDSYWQEIKKYKPDHVFSFLQYSIINNLQSMNNFDTAKFLKDNDLKFVRNQDNGQFGRILQGKLRIIQSTDRGVLLLLDDKIRNGGVNIPKSEWDQLPSEQF